MSHRALRGTHITASPTTEAWPAHKNFNPPVRSYGEPPLGPSLARLSALRHGADYEFRRESVRLSSSDNDCAGSTRARSSKFTRR